MKYLRLFDEHSQYESFTGTDAFLKPNVSHCIEENEVHYNPMHNYVEDYLTFVALESGTFTFTPNNNNIISYSIDNGTTWTEGNTVSVNNGDKVLWKGTMTPSSSYPQGIGTFSSTAEFDVQGNAMSLLFGGDFKGQTSLTGKNYAFYNLFNGNTKVVNAENLSLPATILSSQCYNIMFNRCTALTTAPVLPATTLADNCYSSMFVNCTSLVAAPELPATTLTNNCYRSMFYNCSSLTTAPVLPATTLADSCYREMFYNCTSLNYIKAMFTTTPSTSYTRNWVNGVAATGTFVKNSAATWTTTGIHAVPTGWTVETASS